MYIMNQKRDIIVNFSQCAEIFINSDSCIKARPSGIDNVYFLGTYPTKEVAQAVLNDEDMDCLSRILSADTAYLRFNGAKVNGTQRTQTTIIDSESRQGMTDIINLYNLLQSATAEERQKALQD
jgi:hypothetical protein